MPPSNDNIANATVITASGTINGTTVGSTAEPGLETSFGYVNTVWYKFVIATSGTLTLTTTLASASFEMYTEAYRFAGTPSDAGDVIDNGTFLSSLQLDTNVSFPDLIGATSVTAGDVIYMLVTSDSFVEGDTGTFSFDVSFPLIYHCLNARDYLGSSSTASIVSGNVQEGQTWDADEVAPFEGWFSDLEPTLTIPGEDIAVDGPGFYAAKLSYDNMTGNEAWVGIARNGQPLFPGTDLVRGSDGNAHTEWLTVPRDSSVSGVTFPFASDVTQMLWYLPVEDGDIIDVYVCANTFSPGDTIDLVQLCFAKILSGSDGPAYDLLDIPDYPLGMVAADLDTQPEAQGPNIIYADGPPGGGGSPSFLRHEIFGCDMVVTDNGDVWVAANISGIFGASPFIGPYLMRWNGSSWTIINDDIAGYGVSRSQRGNGSTGNFGPSGVSIATDGEDIWICYGVVTGAGPQGGYNMGIEVRKYDVSANSWSTLGGPINYNTTTNAVNSRAGEFGTTPSMHISPAGVPWVAFYDSQDVDAGLIPLLFNFPNPACAARWNGSSWDVSRLVKPTMMPTEFPTSISGYTHFDPQTYRNAGSGTTSSVTEDGEAAVKDSQTTQTNKTIQGMIPPAGDWAISVRYKVKLVSGSGNIAASTRMYKNGVGMNGGGIDPSLFSSTGTRPFQWSTPTQYYGTFNGTTDTLEIALWHTASGSAVSEAYISDVVLIPAWVAMTMGGNWFTPFVDDGQFHHILAWKDGDDNPYSIHHFFQIDPQSVPTNSYRGLYEQGYHFFSLQKWNGSAWERKWEHIPEDDLPGQLAKPTRPLSHPANYIGHWQQGMAFTSDGTDLYLGANLGYNGSQGEVYIACKCDDNGMVPISDAPAGVLGGSGAAGSIQFPSWNWLMSSKSILVDSTGTLWFANSVTDPIISAGVMIQTLVPDSGIGDWFSASEKQLVMGIDSQNDSPLQVLAISPDETKLYVLCDIDIGTNNVLVPQPFVFGVWEMDIIRDAKIPLVTTIGGKAVRIYPDGRIELISAPPKRVSVSPTGEVTVIGTAITSRVSVAPTGEITVLGS